jgi:hypothetical protein
MTHISSDQSRTFRVFLWTEKRHVDPSSVPEPAGFRDVDRTPPRTLRCCRFGHGVRQLQRTTTPVARGPELRLAVNDQRAVSQHRHP